MNLEKLLNASRKEKGGKASCSNNTARILVDKVTVIACSILCELDAAKRSSLVTVSHLHAESSLLCRVASSHGKRLNGEPGAAQGVVYRLTGQTKRPFTPHRMY
jgi:hypothetical protein